MHFLVLAVQFLKVITGCGGDANGKGKLKRSVSQGKEMKKDKRNNASLSWKYIMVVAFLLTGIILEASTKFMFVYAIIVILY